MTETQGFIKRIQDALGTAEEGPGETDRPEYIELRAILAKLPK
jgi:hypothetical protein